MFKFVVLPHFLVAELENTSSLLCFPGRARIAYEQIATAAWSPLGLTQRRNVEEAIEKPGVQRSSSATLPSAASG